jgi:hypothetical protein
MLSRRRTSGLPRRAMTSAVALALIVPMLATAGPAGADDPPGDTSPIGDGAISPPEEFIPITSGDQGNTTLTPGAARDDACVKLPGLVAPGDIPAQYRTTPPKGDGSWEYQVCAETGAGARDVARDHPSVASARAYCEVDPDRPPAADAVPCAVFVYWHPKERQPLPPPRDQDRKSYFNSFFTLSPELETSPDQIRNQGVVANFPTWMWSTTVTAIPRALGDFGFFGGFVVTAWHLNTEIDTDGHDLSKSGHRVCRVAGFHNVGTKYNAGKYPAGQKSPDCGWTYDNIGTYNVHACSTWLIIAVGPFFAIVFPITLCNDWDVPVKESQILTGADATRARLGG